MLNFLAIGDCSRDELEDLLELALRLKKEYLADCNQPILDGKILGMVFQKPSLRTRVSFEVGMRHLGGQAIYLSPEEIGLGTRESVPDVARVLSGYVHGIMARVFQHDHITQLAHYASVPVINGLSDYNHPCQALTDVLTICEHRETLEGLKIAFVGDGNNVASSLLHICAILGITFAIAAPEGFELDRRVVSRGRQLASESGSDILETRDPREAVSEADVIYTDAWTSMGQERQSELRRKVFPPYQVNEALLSKAKPDALVMHDLPAHRGEEITDAVADGKNSVIFPQAHNRLHAQKAILAHLLAEQS